MERPLADRGDDAAIASLLKQLQSAEVVRFVSEEAGDLSAYGLDRPWLSVSVYEGQGLLPKTIIFGEGTGTGRYKTEYFAKRVPGAAVVAVDSIFARNLMITPWDLRYKRIFAFGRGGVDRLKLLYADHRTDCRRNPDRRGWTVLYPAGHRVRKGSVGDLIHLVSILEAKRFVSKRPTDLSRFGLDRPVLQVRLLKGEQVVREIFLGRASGQVYAMGDGRPEIVEVDPRAIDGLSLPVFLADPGTP